MASSGLTNVGGVAKHPCYAHFPGSGPPGMRCSNCQHILKVSKKNSVCTKAAELIKFTVVKTWPKARHIDAQALACRYFEKTKQRLF